MHKFLSIGFFVFLFIWGGCNSSLNFSQGTETGNGSKLVGVVLSPDQNKVEGVILQLYQYGSLPAKLVATETSNGEGVYEFSNLEPGRYNLELISGSGNLKFMEQKIEIPEDKEIIDLQKITLASSGSWIFRLPDSLRREGSVLAIAGTSIQKAISVEHIDEEYILFSDIFAGKFEGLAWTPTGDFEMTYDLDIEVEIFPSKTQVTGDYHRWSFHRKANFSFGELQNTLFNYPIPIRLKPGEFNFSEALEMGLDLRFSNAFGRPLAFAIEEWEPSESGGMVWVMADSIGPTDKENQIFVHWGNSNPMDEPPIFEETLDSDFHGIYGLSSPKINSDFKAQDRAGKNNGIWQGEIPIGVNGVLGSAAQFNGVDQFIETTVLDTNPTEFTLSFWFKTNSKKSGNLIQYWDQKGFDRHIWMDTLGHIKFGIFEDSSFIEERQSDLSRVRVLSSPGTYNDGKWHYLVGVFAPGDWRLYLDNELVASTDSVDYASNHYGKWRIGSGTVGVWDSALTHDYFEGQMDEVRIQYKSSSREEISLEYKTQSPSSEFLEFNDP